MSPFIRVGALFIGIVIIAWLLGGRSLPPPRGNALHPVLEGDLRKAGKAVNAKFRQSDCIVFMSFECENCPVSMATLRSNLPESTQIIALPICGPHSVECELRTDTYISITALRKSPAGIEKFWLYGDNALETTATYAEAFSLRYGTLASEMKSPKTRSRRQTIDAARQRIAVREVPTYVYFNSGAWRTSTNVADVIRAYGLDPRTSPGL